MRLGTIVISFLILGASIWFVAEALEFEGSGTLGEPGGARIPVLFGALAIVLSLSLIAREVVHGSAEAVPFANTMRLAVFFLAAVVYVVAIQWIGYYLATALFLAPVIVFLGSPLRLALPVAVGFVGFIYLVFQKLLGVPLP